MQYPPTRTDYGPSGGIFMPFYIESAQPEFLPTLFERSQAVPAAEHSTVRGDYLPAARR